MLRADKSHHALSCVNCGAPLRKLKALPFEQPKPRAVSHQFAAPEKSRKIEKIKPNRRKSARWLRRFAEEAFDFVEDIFD